MPAKDLNKLSRMVDDALAAALQMGEKTTAQILSMASLEVSFQIESTDNTEPDAGAPSVDEAQCRRLSDRLLSRTLNEAGMRAEATVVELRPPRKHRRI